MFTFIYVNLEEKIKKRFKQEQRQQLKVVLRRFVRCRIQSADNAMPAICMCSVIWINAPPTPMTRMTDAMIKLRLLFKSTLLSISIRNPFDAMIPNSKID